MAKKPNSFSLRDYINAMLRLRKYDKYFESSMVLVMIIYLLYPYVMFTFVISVPADTINDYVWKIAMLLGIGLLPIQYIKKLYWADIKREVNLGNTKNQKRSKK